MTLIAVAFDGHANFLRHARIRRAIEQDAAGIAQQPNRPVRDDKRADQAGKRIHPEPAEGARQQQPDNDHDGDGGIGQDMNDGGPHVVVAVMGAVRSLVIVLIEFKLVVLLLTRMRHADFGDKGMRFRNFVARLQVSVAILERK